MPLFFLINFGEWAALRMLLAEPSRLVGGRVFEIQGFLAVFLFFLRAEKKITRRKERLNFARRLHPLFEAKPELGDLNRGEHGSGGGHGEQCSIFSFYSL